MSKLLEESRCNLVWVGYCADHRNQNITEYCPQCRIKELEAIVERLDWCSEDAVRAADRIAELERQKKAMWDSHWQADQQNQARIAQLEAEGDELNSLLKNESGKFMRAQARLNAVGQLTHTEMTNQWGQVNRAVYLDDLLEALEQKDGMDTNPKD